MKISKSLLILSMLFISLFVICAVSATDDVDDSNIVAASDGGIDEVQSIGIDENDVLNENEINTDVRLNISVVDTPYNENATIEISVEDTNSSHNYNGSIVYLLIDGALVNNMTLDSQGKGSYVIPANTYDVGKYYTMAILNDTNGNLVINGKTFNITKVTPVVSVENVTVVSGQTVTIPFNVTDGKGKRVSGGVLVTIFWENDNLTKYREIEGDGAFNFDLSNMVGLFSGNGQNGTFNISSLLNGTGISINGTTIDFGSLFNGTGSNGTFNFSSLFNGTGISFNGTSIDFGSLFNRTGNGTNGTNFDFSSLTNGTGIDIDSLMNRTGKKTVDTDSSTDLLATNGTETTFDISSLGNRTGNGTGNSSFNIADIVDMISSYLNGKMTFNYLFTPGTYNVTVTYLGSRNYGKASNDTAKLIITPRSIISAEDVVMYYNNGTSYVVNLTDSTGKALANETVTVDIEGSIFELITDENGTASLPIDFESGEYTAIASYGFGNYTDSSIENNIVVLTTISSDDVVKMYKNDTQYYATLLDGQGNPLAKGTDVSLVLNGLNYTRKTDENGTVKMNINLAQGEYPIIVTNPVNNETAINSITVLSTIVDNKDLVKFYKNDSQYILTILGADGKPAPGKVVTFNINGVFYTRQTNASGQAKLNINLGPGEYVITAEYDGCKVSNNITVLPVISASDFTKKYGDSTPFKVGLVDGLGNPLAGATITFNINGVFYNRTTDSNGVAKLNINLMAGEYIITSSYNGLNAASKITITS